MAITFCLVAFVSNAESPKGQGEVGGFVEAVDCGPIEQEIMRLQSSWRGSRPTAEELQVAATHAVDLDRIKELALARYWSVAPDADLLRVEAERLIETTSWPDRLRQIYIAAEDSVGFQDCVIRPRWIRQEFDRRFAADPEIHLAARLEAQRIVQDLRSGKLDRRIGYRGRTVESRSAAPTTKERLRDSHWRLGVEAIELTDAMAVVADLPGPQPGEMAVYRLPKRDGRDWLEESDFEGTAVRMRIAKPAPGLGRRIESRGEFGGQSLLDDVWVNGSLDFLREKREHTAVWTGAEMLIWGGRRPNDTGDQTGYRFDPVLNSWSEISTSGAPSGRSEHVAVWTGSEMLVWGLRGGTIPVEPGGRYDPATDSWAPMTTAGAPENRFHTQAVWTGTEMLVWGGGRGSGSLLADGGRYNPSTDSWQPIQTLFAPSARWMHSATWTGSELVIWGGSDTAGNQLADGGRYSPALDRWFPISAPPAGFAPREEHASVWAGSQMLIWGGRDTTGNTVNTGALYDPALNSWIELSSVGSPQGFQIGAEAFWNGSEILIVSPDKSPGEGGIFDPASNSWTAVLPAYPSLTGRSVWTGTELLVWGYAQGFRLTPGTNVWSPIPQPTSLPARRDHTAVWTGVEMIVWGGAQELPPFELSVDDGAAYDPALDTWRALSSVGAPSARQRHVADWTGSEMLIWGPADGFPGGRYDPLTDTWVPIAPSSESCVAEESVWTGSQWILWNGDAVAKRGCRYDPNLDSWSSVSTTGAPGAEFGFSTTWTGNEMVVWGGRAGSTDLAAGGAYDPAADSWRDVAMPGAPTARRDHAAVWTGNSMLIWGGTEPDPTTVGSWNASANSWIESSTPSFPEIGLAGTVSTWTGSEFLIWGGDAFAPAAFGGRFDPLLADWIDTSMVDVPNERTNHTGVWTGREFLVWGGTGNGFGLTMSSGGSYRAIADSDGDGVVGELDCQPLDPAAFSVPGSVSGLGFTSANQLEWDSAAPSAGVGTMYDVVRAVYPWGYVETPWQCEATGIPDSQHLDPSEPLPGGCFAYLVDARNICGWSGWGENSNGDPRDVSSCPNGR